MARLKKWKQMNGEIHEFIEVYLYVGFDERKHGYLKSQQKILDLEYKTNHS